MLEKKKHPHHSCTPYNGKKEKCSPPASNIGKIGLGTR
jgi:hypothetical protein